MWHDVGPAVHEVLIVPARSIRVFQIRMVSVWCKFELWLLVPNHDIGLSAKVPSSLRIESSCREIVCCLSLRSVV